MVFMVLRALCLSSLLFLSSCAEKIELNWFNRSSLHLENRNGVMYQDDAPFSGMIYELNEANDTVAIIGFYNGKEHGAWRRFYPTTKIAEERFYDNGVKVKSLKRWYENGQPQLECTFKDGEYEGKYQEWYENGQLYKEMHYKNGHEEGAQKLYYENGKIRSNYFIKNGKRIGLLGTKNCVNVSDSIFKK